MTPPGLQEEDGGRREKTIPGFNSFPGMLNSLILDSASADPGSCESVTWLAGDEVNFSPKQ